MKLRHLAALAALVLTLGFAGGVLGARATKVYFEDGGNKLVVADGGEIEIQSGGTLDVQSGAGASAFALLAGDADGQTIQGHSGSNAARIDIGETSETVSALYGSGATPGTVQASDQGGYIASADEGTFLDLYDGTLELETDGYLSLTSPAIRLLSSQTAPTNADDTCAAGDTILSASYLYYCSAPDTWTRVALATWP